MVMFIDVSLVLAQKIWGVSILPDLTAVMAILRGVETLALVPKINPADDSIAKRITAGFRVINDFMFSSERGSA